VKVAHECIPCLLSFIDNVADRLFEEEDSPARLRLLRQAAAVLAETLGPDAAPCVSTELSTSLWRRAVLPLDTDPFAAEKRLSNDLALRLLPQLQRLLDSTAPLRKRLALAVKIALVGNYIDLHAVFHTGAEASEDFILGLLDHLEEPLGVDDLEPALDALLSADRILYLFDNAGEIVFDTLLIDLLLDLDKQVVGVVKSPFANNATLDDARQVGLVPKIPVVSTDNDTDGLPQSFPAECNVHFVRLFKEPGWLKIMKGMSLYESSTEPTFDPYGPYLHLLKLKCTRILRDVAARTGRSPQLLDSVVWLRK